MFHQVDHYKTFDDCQNLERAQHELKKNIAKELRKEIKTDIMCVRSSIIKQSGRELQPARRMRRSRSRRLVRFATVSNTSVTAARLVSGLEVHRRDHNHVESESGAVGMSFVNMAIH